MSQTPVSKVVNVTISTSPTFPKRKGFGLLLILGSSAILPVAERTRTYADIAGVAADFGVDTEEYAAAQIFFSQLPRPTELSIGRRFPSAVAGQLLGSVNYEKVITSWSAVADGSFTLKMDGTEQTVTGIDLSSVANLNAAAAVIQAALQSVAPRSTVVFNGQRFVISSGTTGPDSTVSFTTPAATGTDLGTLMGTRADDRGITAPGAAAESISESLQKMQDYNSAWYGFVLTQEATNTQILEAAAWAESRVKIFGFTTRDSDVQDIDAEDDIASQLKERGYSRTYCTWDENNSYAVVSDFARAFTVNFNAADSTITLKFKQRPGITPVDITESQRLAFVAKNVNYYTYFGDSAMVAEGVMVNGRFFDEVHGLDWFKNAIETNVFGYLYTRTTKVPQTDAGVGMIEQQVEKACGNAVANGLLAPGVWNGNPLGEVQTGDYLSKGYYLYAQPIAEQNLSDREARKAPPIQIIAKGGGAIHFVDIGVTFER
jgi:hypothetical protein